MQELINALGGSKVTQPDGAKIPQGDHRRQAVAGAVDNRLGNEHLAPVRRLHDPCCTIHRGAEQIVVPALDNAHMQSTTHTKRDSIRRLRVGQCKLQVQRGAKRVLRVVKYGVHPIASHLHDNAAVLLNRRPRQSVVLRKRPRHPVTLLLPQPGASFDVSKHDSDNASAFAWYHCCPSPVFYTELSQSWPSVRDGSNRRGT